MNGLNKKPRALRRWVIMLVCGTVGGLFWMAARGNGPQPKLGTLFAPSAHAAEAASPAAPAHDATTPATKDTDDTQTTASAGVMTMTENIFGDDPLESLAMSLKTRQRELDKREQELQAEAQRVEALRKEVEQNLARSQQVLKQMEQLAGNAATQRDKELLRWIKIYEGMAPAQAGQVLGQLDLDFARELLARMDPKKASKILSAFPPDKAVELGKLLKEKTNS